MLYCECFLLMCFVWKTKGTEASSDVWLACFSLFLTLNHQSGQCPMIISQQTSTHDKRVITVLHRQTYFPPPWCSNLCFYWENFVDVVWSYQLVSDGYVCALPCRRCEFKKTQDIQYRWQNLRIRFYWISASIPKLLFAVIGSLFSVCYLFYA